MAPPARAEAGRIWIGRYTDAPGDGWLDVADPVSVAQLAVFQTKVTIGDATKDSDDFISSFVQNDWSGGGQIENLNEGSDLSRFWWGTADTRGPSRIGLGPLVTSTKPGAAAGTCWPVGIAYDENNANPAPAFVFGTKVYTYSGGAWSNPSATTLINGALRKGASFQGTADPSRWLYVAGGAGYFAVRRNSAALTDPVVFDIAASATKPRAVSLSVHNTSLYCLDYYGYLWQTVSGGNGWVKVEDFIQNDLRLDPSHAPRHLITYFNREGQPTLFVVSDRGVWMYDQAGGRFEQTSIQLPALPGFGAAVAIFRSGEDLWLAAGGDTIRYTSANVIVPNSGPMRDEGLPSSVIGSIQDLEPELSSLYALVYNNTAGNDSLLAWTGIGWHGVAEGNWGQPTFAMVEGTTTGTYRLWWGSTDGNARYITLPERFFNAKQAVLLGNQTFAASSYVETGWFDANMLGFGKLASHVSVYMENATASETLTVKYRTDAAVAANPSSPAWTTLGTITAAGLRQIAFDPNGDGFAEGLFFNRVQFRFEFARGATTTTSPIMHAFVLHFTKVPQDTSSFALKIRLPARDTDKDPTKLVTRLNALLVEDEFLCLVHLKRQYRCRIAGVSGSEGTGEHSEGVRTISVIVINEGV